MSDPTNDRPEAHRVEAEGETFDVISHVPPRRAESVESRRMTEPESPAGDRKKGDPPDDRED